MIYQCGQNLQARNSQSDVFCRFEEKLRPCQLKYLLGTAVKKVKHDKKSGGKKMSDLEGWSRVIEENDDQEDKEKQSKSINNCELSIKKS